MGLFSSLFGGGKPDESQKEKQDNKNFDILKYDGMRARNMRQLPYAVKCLEQAVALKAEPEAVELLASAYTEANRLEDARKTLVRLTEITPEQTRAWLSLAQVCWMLEDYAAMEGACQKAISLEPDNATACFLAARAAHALKNDLQAIAMLTKATVQNETYTEAYLLRAEILWKMGQAKEATEDVGKVLSQAPDHEEAWLLKGEIQAAGGHADEAYACFDRVAEANPFNEKAYLLKGSLQLESRLFGQAVDTYTEALELMPENARLYQERGRARLLQGDKEGSVNDLKKAIELNPEQEKLITGNYDNFGQKPTAGIY